jgi:plastocyanin domain-containing protein
VGPMQEIRMTAASSAYSPDSFTVQAGKPVRWVIEGGNSMGCASYLTAPKLGITKVLKKGENIIEFTAPATPGTYPFSCSMNMARGTITVV